jgi:hypothetical protein
MRIPSIALIVAGILLFAWGVVAADSISSTFSRAFSGSPSDKSLWLLVGGIVLFSLGTVGSCFSRKG